MNKKKSIPIELRAQARQWASDTGYSQIAYRCQLEAEAVRKWPVNGFPERYWHILVNIDPNLRISALHEWNKAIRAKIGEK